MKGALRIALVYFSGTPLLSWISLCGFLMAGGGLLLAATSSSPSFASNAVEVAQCGVIAAIFGPLYMGGPWMRTASTPAIMHLYPHGRRQMLFGALLAITLSAVVMALPSTACSFTPGGTEITGSIPFFTVNRDLCGDFGLPAMKQIQLIWGTIALIWVVLFALSSKPVMLAFVWAPLFALFTLLDRLNPAILQAREQFASMVFAAGAVAWSAFAIWYLNAPNALRRNLKVAWTPALGEGKASRRPAAPRSPVSRGVAASQYLTGTDGLAWSAIAVGAFVALLFAATTLLPAEPPLTLNLMAVALIPATIAATSVRRARMVWLRVGLDRVGLFATTERLALRMFILFSCLPFAVMTTITLLRHPDLATRVLLHAGTLLVFAFGALFAGMACTRGTLSALVLLVVAGVPSALILISLQPDTGTSLWAQIGGLLLFIAATMGLRGLARSRWVGLDWRLTGPPVAQDQAWSSVRR